MAKDAYTLKRKKDSKELHLFKGKFKEDGKCDSSSLSLCRKMEKKDSEGANRFACKTEDEARVACAEIGRQVCGVCVSALYETYK